MSLFSRISNAVKSTASKVSNAVKSSSNSSSSSSSSNKSSGSSSSTPTWQEKLSSYAKDTTAGNTEIERARQVYEQKKASGDMAGAESAHQWANQIREAMGTSSQYDKTTGAKLSTPSNPSNPTNAPKTVTLSATVPQPMAKPPTTTSAYTGKFETEINNASKKYGLDPYLIASVIQRESSYNPKAVSSAGAQGLMQLMPGTAKSLGVTDSYNASQNIDGGAKYLKQLIDRFGGDVTKALAGYNGGPNRKVFPKETLQYANNVLSTYQKLTGNAYGTKSNVKVETIPNAPQAQTWQDKLKAVSEDTGYLISEIARAENVIKSGNGDMTSANRYLNQLKSIAGGMSAENAISGQGDNYMKTNNYAQSLSIPDRMKFYKENPEALMEEAKRVHEAIENGTAKDMVSAKRWDNQLSAMHDGYDINDIIAGKYDDYNPDEQQGAVPSVAGQQMYTEEELQQKLSELLNEQLPYNEDVYEQVKDIFQDNNQDVPDVLNDKESYALSEKQVNPLYDQGMREALKQVDNNNLSRGFFGQLPGAELERSTAVDIESKRASAIAQLATALKGQSQEYAQSIVNSNMQNNQNQLTNLLSALSYGSSANQNKFSNLITYLQTLNNKGAIDFDKQVKEADLTGYYKGQPTIQYQELLQNMGLKQQEAELQAKELDAKIQKIQSDMMVDYEKLKIDHVQLAQTAEKIGISRQNLNLAVLKYQQSGDKFVADISFKAQQMADKYFLNVSDAGTPDSTQYASKIKYYTDVLLNKTTPTASDSEMLDALNAEGGFELKSNSDYYKDKQTGKL